MSGCFRNLDLHRGRTVSDTTVEQPGGVTAVGTPEIGEVAGQRIERVRDKAAAKADPVGADTAAGCDVRRHGTTSGEACRDNDMTSKGHGMVLHDLYIEEIDLARILGEFERGAAIRTD